MTGASLTVVVPARDAVATLPRCLDAVQAALARRGTCIVVDDGSSDDTAATAGRHGATVVRRAKPGGPAVARNAGIAHAKGAIVMFVDADVVVARDAVDRVLAAFEADPGLAAVFGSYDDTSSAGTLVSDYRNLLHHFVHQRGNADSRTFWAGLGAVRRTVLDACGGFDERYERASIEDIALGVRLASAGYRIRLDRDLRGTHLKRWTFRQMVYTDVTARALPWSRLLLREKSMPPDLNLQWQHRASGLLVWSVAACAVVATAVPTARAVSAVASVSALAGLVLLNVDFYRFLTRRRGVGFAAGAFPLHVLYYAYASGTFAWCCVEHLCSRAGRSTPTD